MNPDLSFIEEGSAVRIARRRARSRRALAVSAAATVAWVVFVAVTGQWERVASHYLASITMVFGSVVAGSTPQGGGAVAFPVLTKVLQVPSEVARTFSLSVQAFGMGVAALSILINRRRVEWKAVSIVAPVAIISFLGWLWLLARRDVPFWPMVVPGPYVKVTFTLILAAMAFIVFLQVRTPIRQVQGEVTVWSARLVTALVVAGILGGLASALTGSGTDVFLYLVLALLIGVEPKVGVPSSVVVMAMVSLTGFLVMGVGAGHLDVGLNAAGDVISVGGTALEVPLEGARWDLYGLLLASIPVVVWGAPLGSMLASRMSRRSLVIFVMALAIAETLSTAIFLTELRTDRALLAYAVIGLVVAVGGLWLLVRYRRAVLGLPAFDPSASIRRGDVDVAPDFEERLEP
jgi:uncharacterized protein